MLLSPHRKNVAHAIIVSEPIFFQTCSVALFYNSGYDLKRRLVLTLFKQ